MATVKVEGNELVIRLPLQPPTPSASGKTLVVATTRGNMKTGVNAPNGKEITIGVNAYTSR